MEGHDAYPDRGEKGSNNAKNSRSRGHARRFLSDVHHADGDVQREDSTVALCWLLSFACHGRCELAVQGKGHAGDSGRR